MPASADITTARASARSAADRAAALAGCGDAARVAARHANYAAGLAESAGSIAIAKGQARAAHRYAARATWAAAAHRLAQAAADAGEAVSDDAARGGLASTRSAARTNYRLTPATPLEREAVAWFRQFVAQEGGPEAAAFYADDDAAPLHFVGPVGYTVAGEMMRLRGDYARAALCDARNRGASDSAARRRSAAFDRLAEQAWAEVVRPVVRAAG